MKRLIKFAAMVVVALAAIGAVMYALGGRIYMDGGGGLHVGFPESPVAHEQTVEQHRKAQETAPVAAQNPAPEPANPSPSASAAASTTAADWTDFRGPARDGV